MATNGKAKNIPLALRPPDKSAEKGREPTARMGAPMAAKVLSPLSTTSEKKTPRGSTTSSKPEERKSVVAEAKKNLTSEHGDKDPRQELHAGRHTDHLIAKKAQANLVKTESRKAKNLFQTHSASRYEAIAKEYDDWSEAYLAKTRTWPSLLSRFGVAIAAQTDGKRIDQKSNIVMKWDKDGNGTISLQEFRIQVKALHLGEKDCKEIDALFTGFDNDKSEKLELAELKVAVKRALAMAQDVDSRTSDAQVQVNMWLEHKKQALELAEQTAEYEEEKQRCAEMKAAKGESLMEKLGKKSSTIGEMVQWDKDGDGNISLPEFRKWVKAAGFKIDNEAVDNLYASLDEDKSGEIDFAELKGTLKKLQLAAATVATDLVDEEELVLELEKMVSKRQKRFEKTYAEDKNDKVDLLEKLEMTEEEFAALHEQEAAEEAAKAAAEDAKVKKHGHGYNNDGHRMRAATAIADSVFKKVAGKKAGVMTLEELSDYLLDRGDMPIPKIMKIFELLDKNQDGTISRQEWRDGFLAGVVDDKL